jgi:hypothetical protein
LCVATVEHRDDAAFAEFLDVFPRQIGWDFDAEMELDASGDSVISTLIMTREGQPLAAN